ncbi:MAG: nucleotidyltransferase family protein [Clostridia bacterium]|nr:nucleotidyltransferase family protein [Clostridia bacterium]
MRVAGIIAEYNPFHKGHAYQVEQTRKYADCGYVIAVMSGAFTQRGDPAILDKWTRVRAALKSGVDVVLELPALFAVRPADRFAAAGVDLLNALGVVDTLSFGCETDDVVKLNRMADLLESEPEELKVKIREKLGQGCSHARARGEALAEMLHLRSEEVNAPNTVLALEYIRANNRLPVHMELMVVKRRGDYHAANGDDFPSATAVRALLRDKRCDEALSFMPEAAAEICRKACQSSLSDGQALDNALLYRLRNMPLDAMAELADVNEGLENRLYRSAQQACSREALLQAIKCKRYTMARLNRILTYAMLGITQELAEHYQTPPYARLLGFRNAARPLLRTIASTSSVPLISDTVMLREDACFAIERRATDLWGLSTADPELRRAGRDLTEKMILELD